MGAISTVTSMVWDYRDAFHQIPLAADGMGFGGRAFPLVFGRVISFIARATQAMLHPNVARPQTYVDDPVMSVMAPRSCFPSFRHGHLAMANSRGGPFVGQRGQ